MPRAPLLLAACCCAAGAARGLRPTPRSRAPVPPMGWMDWEAYRCNINEELIRNTTDAMVAGGWLAAGYDTVHIDDCWAAKERDAAGRLVADPTRFPSGIAALAAWVHSRGMKLGIYSAAAPLTCARFQPGSEGREAVDAQTFVDWDVDYLKYDGCQQNQTALGASYRAMGAALAGTRIVYACSWGAHGGGFADMVAAGCDLWRLWHDIEGKKGWGDVVRIAEHWADGADSLRPWSGPAADGRGWHDPDQLLMGDERITTDEAVAQLGAWALLSAPLILGNRLIDGAGAPAAFDPALTAAYQNPEIVAVARDPLAAMGGRVGPRSAGDGGHEVWARRLSGGAAAVMVWNKATPDTCEWDVTPNTTAGNAPSRLACVHGGRADYTRFECCARASCTAFTFTTGADTGAGCLYGEPAPGWRAAADTSRWALRSRAAPPAMDVVVDLAALAAAGVWNATSAAVRDLLRREDAGVARGQLTARAVPYHGVALLKLTPA